MAAIVFPGIWSPEIFFSALPGEETKFFLRTASLARDLFRVNIFQFIQRELAGFRNFLRTLMASGYCLNKRSISSIGLRCLSAFW